MITRHASAAGRYYPRDADILKQTIERLSRRARVPKRTVMGALVPHSGLAYAGETQAHLYKSIVGSPVFVIVGANHARLGDPYSIMTKGQWSTPLGTVPIDSTLAEEIKTRSSFLKEDLQAHIQEHSIETQIPWLQILFSSPSFVPISIYGNETNAHKEIGNAIRAAAHQTGRGIVVIASSDLTRYGAPFGFVPTSGNPQHVLEWIGRIDEVFIKALLERSVDKIQEAAAKTNICGIGAIETMLHATTGVTTGASLLHYATSFPVSGSAQEIISFASLVFE